MKIFFSEKRGVQDRAIFVRLKVFRLKTEGKRERNNLKSLQRNANDGGTELITICEILLVDSCRAQRHGSL